MWQDIIGGDRVWYIKMRQQIYIEEPIWKQYKKLNDDLEWNKLIVSFV